jgi:hypothetical protein
VLGVALGPLRQGVDLWLSRGERPLGDHLVWFAWQPWYVGFRRLELGDRPLWLGVYLPWREVLPELYPRLAVVVLVLLSALLAGSRLARRFAAALGRP